MREFTVWDLTDLQTTSLPCCLMLQSVLKVYRTKINSSYNKEGNTYLTCFNILIILFRCYMCCSFYKQSITFTFPALTWYHRLYNPLIWLLIFCSHLYQVPEGPAWKWNFRWKHWMVMLYNLRKKHTFKTVQRELEKKWVEEHLRNSDVGPFHWLFHPWFYGSVSYW